jgi:hypothetical protein
MSKLGDLLGLLGLIIFLYTLAARFIGDTSILGLSNVPFLGQGFTAVGTFSAAACILLLAVLAKMKSMEK